VGICGGGDGSMGGKSRKSCTRDWNLLFNAKKSRFCNTYRKNINRVSLKPENVLLSICLLCENLCKFTVQWFVSKLPCNKELFSNYFDLE
jgi:hypothetical protein